MAYRKLKTLQINTNRSQSVTEHCLQMCIEQEVDLLAIQEPWIISNTDDYTDARSIAHSSFVQILPRSSRLRPRVLVYFRKSAYFTCSTSDKSPVDPDILIINTFIHHRFRSEVVNLYNGKHQDKTLRFANYNDSFTFQRQLHGLELNQRSIVLGDFNSHHPLWDPFNNMSPNANNIFSWIEINNLQVHNQPGMTTFSRPNAQSIIDLTLSTEKVSISDWTTTHETLSDHFGIFFEFSSQSEQDSFAPPLSVQQQRWDTKKADWDAFSSSLIRSFSSMAICGDKPSILVLENAANWLTEAIQQAANTSIPLVKTGAKAKPWWTPELKALRKRVTRAYRKHDSRIKPLRNEYLSAIKRAKSQHWNNFLEDEAPENIYKAFRYTKNSFTGTLPTIQGNNTFESKASCLKQGLFPSPPLNSPLVWDYYNANSTTWDWPELQRKELALACSSTAVKGKTPGPDGITQEIIQHAYLAIPDVFFSLYAGLVNKGYHPEIWRRSTGAVLKKPGKLPEVYSTPKGYRVIALLSCLGKISERIFAKRLSALAESTKLLHPSQLGGRRQKSAVDAALLLVSGIQANKKAKLKTSCVFLDVKGAFDHVSRNRLLQILINLQIPQSFIRWTESFLMLRSTKLTFDNQIESDFTSINTGIPQGSPISPILFLIYIRELFTSSPSITQLSYIDDISLQVSSRSIKKNVAILERELGLLFKKSKELCVEFDLTKTELIHFDQTNIPLQLPTKESVQPARAVKWLGIIFDSKLSFRDHVSFRACKALAAFHRLSRLTNTSRGLSPDATRNLYLACIKSVSDYGSQVWFTGRKQDKLLKPLQLLQNKALRKILGAFRTTSIVAMESEAGLLPVKRRLELLNQKYCLRTLRLHRNHPVSHFLQKDSEFQQENGEHSNVSQLVFIKNTVDTSEAVPARASPVSTMWKDWKSKPPDSTFVRRFGWNPRRKPIKPKGATRASLSAFYQLKFNHGYFSTYLHRFNKIENDRCLCGARESPDHLIYSCPLYNQERQELYNRVNNNRPSVRLLFNSQKGIEALISYIQSTGISTRAWYLEREAIRRREEDEEGTGGEMVEEEY